MKAFASKGFRGGDVLVYTEPACGIYRFIYSSKVNYFIFHSYCTSSISDRNAMNLSPHLSIAFFRSPGAWISI